MKSAIDVMRKSEHSAAEPRATVLKSVRAFVIDMAALERDEIAGDGVIALVAVSESEKNAGLIHTTLWFGTDEMDEIPSIPMYEALQGLRAADGTFSSPALKRYDNMAHAAIVQAVGFRDHAAQADANGGTADPEIVVAITFVDESEAIFFVTGEGYVHTVGCTHDVSNIETFELNTQEIDVIGTMYGSRLSAEGAKQIQSSQEHILAYGAINAMVTDRLPNL